MRCCCTPPHRAPTYPNAPTPTPPPQAAPVDQQKRNALPPALTRRYDVYIHVRRGDAWGGWDWG